MTITLYSYIYFNNVSSENWFPNNKHSQSKFCLKSSCFSITLNYNTVYFFKQNPDIKTQRKQENIITGLLDHLVNHQTLCLMQWGKLFGQTHLVTPTAVLFDTIFLFNYLYEKKSKTLIDPSRDFDDNRILQSEQTNTHFCHSLVSLCNT